MFSTSKMCSSKLFSAVCGVFLIGLLINTQESYAKGNHLFSLLTFDKDGAVKVTSKIKCTENEMSVEIPQSSYIRSIYLDGLKDYPDKHCQPEIDSNKESYIFNLSLINIFQCGVTRMTHQLTGKRVYYHRIIIETNDANISKEILYVKCSIASQEYPIEKNHTLTKRNVLPAGFQEPEDLEITTTLFKKAPEPILGVNVRQGGVPLSGGQLHVAPGTPLQMEIFLDNVSAPIYGLLVTHMQVTDTGSQEETIIYNGCSIDPYLFDNFNTVDGDLLTAKFRAFKFPESTYVQFRGTVNVCLDKCKGIECSNGVIGYGRRKRDISSLPPDPNKVFEITITSFIKVNFENETKNLDEIIDKQMHTKHRKFITGPTDDQGENIVVKDDTGMSAKQLNLGQGSSIEEVQYTAIVEETLNSASTNYFNAIMLLLCLMFNTLRHL